ncbi:IS110 family transposase, partial [Chroococcidiopsis sp.]|uniref:IS110 family transposase n=1 Tax=Chroococcidiopsis sp. TaxID=3088168 RepID=UPI003F3A4266
DSQRRQRNDVPPLWGWLAEERPSSYFDRLWAGSVARDFGLEITVFTRAQAARICNLERQQDAIEQQIEQLLAHPQFDVYHTVFDRFGMGLRVRTLLLSHIYPLSDFLSRNQPLCESAPTKTGHTARRDRSLRAFKLRLGMGLVEDSSGKYTNWIPGGSSLCRQTLWQYVMTRIEPKNNRRLQTEIGQQLGTYLDKQKASGVPVQVVRMRTAAKAVVLLYKELVKAIAPADQ